MYHNLYINNTLLPMKQSLSIHKKNPHRHGEHKNVRIGSDDVNDWKPSN